VEMGLAGTGVLQALAGNFLLVATREPSGRHD
jgi:hypothetical protein